jgi:cytochrome o ubiquinol oxidase subunit 3
MTTPTLSHEEIRKDAVIVFGFWLYLITDLVLFASLFAAFAVLRVSTAGGPALATLFSGPFVLTETILLLTSSFTCGLSFLCARAGKVSAVLGSLVVTAVLGATFLIMELSEFAKLHAEGSGWTTNAALSSYFTLVGTHGLHIAFGLLWAAALVVAIARRGLTRSTKRKLVLFSLFWHFLDLIWIFIFTIVYLFSLI